MAGGASIVVDIKAQISGYKEQIENIKNELKKIDPGSQIGKSLNRTLEQADQKLSKLSRNAEQRITSQGQLDRLFDQLHDVSDLMRNLGQGMQSVGLNDVLLTASDQARQLGQDLKIVQDEMKTKGSNFFEELTKTNPKELQSVFDQLKFDPKTMGVDEFVTKFKEATQSAKNEVKDLTEQQKQAQADLDKTKAMKTMHDQLPVALQGKNVRQDAIRNVFGLNNKGMDQAQLVSDRDVMAQEFIDKIRTSLEADTSRSEENKANLSGTLQETLTKLQEAKTKEQVQSILQDLDKALKSTAGEGHGGSYRGIAGMSGESFNSELISKLTENTYKADQGFIDKLTQLKDLMAGSSSEGAQAAGNQLSTILSSLLNPTDLTTFQNNMQALVSIIQDGLKSVNSATKDFDVTERTSLANSATEALKMAQERVGALDTIGNSKSYTNLMDEYNQLKERMSQIEEKLGIENGKNQSAIAGGINTKGGQLLNTLPIVDKSATDSLKQYTTALEDAQRRQQMMGKVEGIAQRWFSVYAAVRMVSKAFRSMKENVTKIDNTITEIAIVTDMSQSDLWRQMPQYTDMARKYGSSIEGVYQVSQLYYQQGLEQADVMALTEQTLKMARISGLDYTDATNYMTNAIRSFKMEMQDAQTVVDVYSALAASSASSTTELATAMSKTASSAAAVGSSFESTSAMMAVMIETTRESPENIGSALKSIISRYGELKTQPTGIDEEGEEYSLNKVDTALQSVGISIHDAKGEFRDFDDVIMELSQSWDTIDKNTQRYIATVMAGNRQQSRFLALVSNGERLAELTETAENSEDASTLQILKTMDSIAYKSQNLQTSLQSLYTDSGIENLYKGILDGANEVVKTFTDMPTLFQLPIPALASFAMNFISIANIVLTAIQVLKRKFMAQWETDDLTSSIKKKVQQENLVNNERQTQQQITKIRQEESTKRQNIDQKETGTTKGGKLTKTSKAVLGMQLAGTALSLGAGLISDKGTGNRAAKAGMGIAGSTLEYAAMGTMIAPGWGTAIGAVAGGLMGVWQNLSYIWESTADQAKRLKEEADTAKTDYQQKKAISSNAEKEVANIKKLSDAQFDSIEAREKYIESANKLATDMPELVNYYDAEGNAILDLSNAYNILAEKRRAANDASKESAEASLSAADKAVEEKQEIVDKVVTEGITKSIDFGNLNGTAKDKWQAVKATDNIMGWAQAAEIGGGKGNDLSGIIQIANENLLGNTPGLKQLYSLLVADDGAGIRSLIETPDKRDAAFKQWNQELESITDPASKAAIDFVLYQLQGISTELTSAFGELNQATANRTATIHSNAAEYVNNFIAQTRTMAEYGPNGEEKTQAKEMLEMFKDLDNSSEIVTNYLTQQFLANSDKYKTWDDFINDLEDPEKSPLLNFLNILNQIPETLYTELNDLLQHKSQYTKEVMQQKIATLLGNDELAETIINTYSNYYDNLIDAEEFKKQVHKNAPDLGYFRTVTDDGFNVLSTLSGEEMATIVDMQDNIASMYESGRITKSQAHGFIKAYSDLWGTGDEAIQGIMARITDFSAESLEELYTLIDNSDEFTSDEQKETFKQSLATLFGFIPQNLNTNLKSYEEQMITTTKDYSKDMSSATKGMDYEAASELAKKLNIDTSTEYFDVREGELFLKNTSLIYDHYFGKEGISTLLTSKMHEYSEKLQQHVEGLNQLDLQKLDVTKLTKEQAEEDFGVDLVTLKQLITDFKSSGLTTMTDEWISNYFEGTITNTEDLVNILFKSDDLTRAIESGKLEDIVKAATSGTAKNYIWAITEQLETSLQTGDFKYLLDNSQLSDEFKSKLPELKQTYDDAQSSVIDDMISGLDEGFSYIEGTEFNKKLLSELQSKGLVELTPAINGISNAIITGSRDQILTYLESITDASTIGKTTDELRQQIASLRGSQYEKSHMGTLQAIIDNYDNIDEIAYQNFIDNWDFSNVDQIFTRRADGSYKANLAQLAQTLRNSNIQLDDITQEKLNEIVTKAIDDGMSAITGAADYVTKGTTRFQDMATFTKAFNDAIPGINAEVTDLFSYDKDLQGYILDTTSYRTYLEAQKQLLISLGESTEYIDGIIQNANQSIIDAIDVKSFIDAENKGTADAPSQARKALIQQLKNADIWQEEVVKQSEDWRTYYEDLADDARAGMPENYRMLSAKQMAQSAKESNNQVQEAAAEAFIQTIEEGGVQAVAAMQSIAILQNKELTAADIESAYRVEVAKLEDAAEQLTYGVGSLISGDAVQILTDANYDLTLLGDGSSAVINSIGDITTAYQNYYNALKRTNNATLAALNEAYAKVLETKDGKDAEQKAIEALGDASGMTYTTLGAILSDAGMSLEDNLENLSDIVESTGGNKIRIKDFAAFARRMGWDFSSEEYVSAFKTYNDGLIERNTQIKRAVTDEILGIKDIKPGDWLNLTQFSEAYKKYATDVETYVKRGYTRTDAASTANWMKKHTFDALNTRLKKYGAYLDDGLLKTIDDANLIGIAQELVNSATESGEGLTAELAEMYSTILTSYTDAINKGITGGMTETEKADLIQKASDLGVDNIEFTQTTEGFKLAKDSAIALYKAMYSFDDFQGKITFETLKQNLQESNDEYKTSTSLLTHIKQLETKIQKTLKNNNNEHDDTVDKLEEELNLAKQISETDYRNKDADWGWGDNDATPDSYSNSMEYWSDWESMLDNITTWSSSGKVDIDTFLTLMQHAEEVANATGGSMEFFGSNIGEYGDYTYQWIADLLPSITEFDAATNSYYVSLKNLKEAFDIDFSQGRKGLTDDTKNQIKGYTEDLAGMDAAYDTFYSGLYEVQKLLNDSTFEQSSFEDYLTGEEGNRTFDYNTFEANLKKRAKAYEYFTEFTKQLEINGKTWENVKNEMTEGGAGYEAMKSIISMAIEGNWDEGTDQQVISENLLASGFKGSVKLYDQTYHVENGRVIIETEGGEFISPTGENLGQDKTEAVNKLMANELEDLSKTFGEYNKQTESSNFTINGAPYTVTIEEGQYVIRRLDSKGNIVDTGYADSSDQITAQMKQMAETAAEDGSKITNMSDEAFALKQQKYSKPSFGQQGNTQINETTRDWLSKNNIVDSQQLIDTFNEQMETYISSPSEGGLGLSWEDGLLEFQAKTGLKLDVSEGHKLDSATAQKIIDQNNLTQTAADVLNGITAAFSDTGEGSVVNALSTGIANAFTNTEGITIPEIKVNPESIAIGEDITSTPLGDITVPASSITVSSASDLKIDNIPENGIPVPIELTIDKQLGIDDITSGIPKTGIPVSINPSVEKTVEADDIAPGFIETEVSGTVPVKVENSEIVNETIEVNIDVTYAEVADSDIVSPSITVDVDAKVPDGKGKIIYDDSEITIEDIVGPDGSGRIIYDDYAIELPDITGPDGHGKIIYDQSEVTVSPPGSDSGESNKGPKATGNVGFAKGNAHVKSTLMGELGPEMVVSNNRYFVVGQNGPEFVDLADDAIVFNHLQTQSLLSKGTSSTRGKAITNERVATSYAKGSINGGPAKGGLGSRIKLGTTNDDNLGDVTLNAKTSTTSGSSLDQNNFLATLEQWYNWLQKIAVLEYKINLEEAKRTKYSSSFTRSGSDYAKSQVDTLNVLEEELATQRALNTARQEEFDRQRDYYNSSDNPFSKLYTFDETGQIKYQNGAFEQFSELLGSDKMNNPNFSAAEQYDYLVNTLGISADYFKYDTSGKEIDTSKDNWESTAMSAFWSRIESDQEDMQTRYDDIQDGLEKIEEDENSQNEILQEIEDNQIEVESKVLSALEESRQREIDELQNTRDAIEEANNNLIDGLTTQLENEREMYSRQDTADELAKLQRQLAIAQRSGASASTIADLQQQISDKQRDAYFDAQQAQIDALQEASDNELERLDKQIDLMTETLEYQKEHGLLWGQVNEILSKSSEEIMDYIKGNTSDYWSKSSTELEKIIREGFFEVDQFKALQTSIDGGMEALIAMYGKTEEEEEKKEESSEEPSNEQKEAEKKGTWKQNDTGWWYEYDDGTYAQNEWKNINDKWYHFDDNGYMQTGWFQDNDGKWYYLDNTKGANEGAMLTGTHTLTWGGKTENHTFDESGAWVGSSAAGVGGGNGSKNYLITYKDKDGQILQFYAASEYAGKKTVADKGGTFLNASKQTKKASGGYVNHGVYELGEQGTETVLTAQQTNVLRNNILSNRPDSLINLLKSYNEAYHGLSQSTYDSISDNSNITTIERAEVNLQIENLADDYDSKRAANTIMDEMLRIASKTKANNSVRR